MLERVLLAIIDAHATDETEGRKAERLQAAMTALIGPTMLNGHDMDKALQFMVRQRQKDICDLEMRALRSCRDSPTRVARSVPELATLAVREVMGCTKADELREIASVLSAMFRKSAKAHSAEYDHVRDALEAQAVQRFCDELAEWDVPTRL